MNQVNVTKLKLDPENPRLPEDIQGQEDHLIFQYLLENGVLAELVQSMLDNGFFDHEPLIALPENDNGEHIIVEGNRRLAALKLIQGAEETGAFELGFEITPETRVQLESVPIHVVKGREEVRKFLGFRHISGLKPWKPEAKARYLTAEVDALVESGETTPFLTVARRVGSNTVGIRNYYASFKILAFARNEFGTDIRYVLSERFGVWMRCLNSAEFRHFINFQTAREYDEIVHNVSQIHRARLEEVLSDLTPQSLGRSAILSDSRNVTIYGLILNSEKAHSALRKFQSINVARQIVERTDIGDEIDQIVQKLELLQDEIETLETASETLISAANRLERRSKFILSSVNALQNDN